MASFGQTAAILQIGVRADTNPAERALDRFTSKFNKTAADAQKTVTKVNSSLDVKPTLDDKDLKKGIRKAKADLIAFSKVKATPEVNLAIAGASAKLKEMETRLAIFAAKDYDVDVNVDRDGAAQSTLGKLWSLGTRLTTVLGTQLTAAMQSAGGSMSGLSTTAGTTGGNLTLLATVAGEAAAVIGVVVVAAVGAAVTALVALAASAVAATGALAAMGVAAAALAIPFLALSSGAMARFKADSETAGTSAFKLKQSLQDVAEAAVKSFGPGIDAVFRAVGDSLGRLPKIMKELSPLFTDFGKSVGRALNALGKEFTSPVWVKFFGFLLNAASKATGPLTKAFIQLARIFANIAKASMPFLIAGLKALNQWLKGIGEKGGGVKQLSGIISGLVDHLRSWWNLSKALVGIFAGIFTAALGSGKSLVDMLAKGAQALSDWVNSAEGQERIKKFFADVMPLVNQLIPLFGKLALIVLELFEALAPTFASILQGVNLLLKPVIFLLELFNKIPASMRSWIIPGLLGPVIGPIVLLINIVKQLISWVKEKLGPAWEKVWGAIKAAVSAGVDFVQGAAGKIKNAFQNAIEWIKNAWGNLKDFLANPFEAAVGKIRGFINDIIGIINTVLGPIGVHIGEVGGGGGGTHPKSATPPHSKPAKQKQRGGGIGGSGSGDTVPAMLEPGEFVLNRKAVQRVGLEKLTALNKAVPRFQGGGSVQHLIGGGVGKAISGAVGAAKHKAGGTASFGMPSLPGLGDVPGWLKPAGQFVLDKVTAYLKSKIPLIGGGGGGTGGPGPGGVGSYKGVAMANWVIQSLQYAARKGVSPQPTSGYRSHAENVAAGRNYFSEHEGTVYPHGAVDFGGYTTGLAQKMAVVGATSSFKWPLLAPIGFRDDGHASGTGHRMGGLIRKMAGGGAVPNPKHGAHWIKNLGGNIDVDEAATLLWQAGLSETDAGQLARVIHTESGGNPRAHNPSGATGLFQILGSVFPGNLYDPRINAINAAMKWRDAGGFGPWEGAPTGRAGRILRDRVAKLGGAKTPRVKNKKKKPGASGGDGGSDWLDALTQAGEERFAAASEMADIQNTRIGSANELIGQGNFEALQRFQVGSSQNPVLGLAKPGVPTPASMIPSMEPWQFLNQVSNPVGSASPSVHTPIDNTTAQGDLMGHTLPKKGRRRSAGAVVHNHVYIAGREVRHATKTELRRAARGGHRPLPSRGGGL